MLTGQQWRTCLGSRRRPSFSVRVREFISQLGPVPDSRTVSTPAGAGFIGGQASPLPFQLFINGAALGVERRHLRVCQL